VVSVRRGFWVGSTPRGSARHAQATEIREQRVRPAGVRNSEGVCFRGADDVLKANGASESIDFRDRSTSPGLRMARRKPSSFFFAFDSRWGGWARSQPGGAGRLYRTGDRLQRLGDVVQLRLGDTHETIEVQDARHGRFSLPCPAPLLSVGVQSTEGGCYGCGAYSSPRA
jgi:hypothetical protein